MRAFAQPGISLVPRPAAGAARIGLVVAAAWAVCSSPASAQSAYEQVIEFRPGWNAIYLEVVPDPAQIADVLSPANCGGMPSVPLLSVWTFDERFGGVGTIVDPVEGLFTATGWFGFFPASRPESMLNNLFAMAPDRTYLVKMGGTMPVTCSIPGEPVLRSYEWVPDSFNLVGLRVDPSNPPTFETYFAPSKAHAGQPVFRLDPSGIWQPVLSFVETPRAGEAYWVFSHGPSSYRGPLEVELDSGDELDFGEVLDRGNLTLRNLLDVDASVTLRRLGSPTPLPLRYRAFNDETGRISWPAFPDDFAVPVIAENESLVSLSPDRSLFSGAAAQVLEVTSEFGSRVLLFLSAETAGSGAAGATGRARYSSRSYSPSGSSTTFGPAGGLGGAPTTLPADEFAGLWVGSAEITGVSEILCEVMDRECACRAPGACSTDGEPCVRDNECGLVDDTCSAGACSASGDACEDDGDCPGVTQVCVDQLVDPGDAFECDPECPDGEICTCNPRECASATAASGPQPVGRSFPLRLMVHVDRQGQARLLKEVIQLFKAPVIGPDPATPGYQSVIDPGSFVLVTDDDLIDQFGGVAVRDGTPVGLRASTAAYDFDESTPGWDGENRALPMVGSFGTTGVSVMIEIDKNDPTNPFRHQFHPDHDNLSEKGIPLGNVCSETDESCTTDDDCNVPTPAEPICLPSGDPCPAGSVDCCTLPGEMLAPAISYCEESRLGCATDDDCQEQICEANEASCTSEIDCLEIDTLAPVAVCAGDLSISCSGDDCGDDGPCIPRQICEADRGIACVDDASCVDLDPVGTGNNSVCDGNLLRGCIETADCAGIDDQGVDFDDGACVAAQDDGPCVPVRSDGPCIERYAGGENACVAGVNLGACFERAEAPSITRTIELIFADTLDSFCTQGCGGPTDPEPREPLNCRCTPPGWGGGRIGGTYKEFVTGLHRVPIEAEGEFTLRRVADTPVLNREP